MGGVLRVEFDCASRGLDRFVQVALARVDPEFQEAVRNSVILSGCTSLIQGLDKALAKELDEVGGGKVTRVKDPVFAGSDGGLSLAQDAVDSDWEKLSS